MMSKFLIIPNKMNQKKERESDFLFPLKGFCVGFQHEWSIKEIPPYSFLYVNRLLDTEAMNELGKILLKEKIKGIVFEDLGILEFIREKNLPIETCLYATHAVVGLDTINAYLKYCDTVVISPDITKEETDSIIEHAEKAVSLYIYGPLPYMYSRRSLLKNYQKVFGLKEKNIEILEEEKTKKEWKAIENEYGTVLYDGKKYDGRCFLNKKNVKYYLINLDWEEDVEIEEWFHSFLNHEKIENTTTGFLYQKTIYRLPPKGETHD